MFRFFLAALLALSATAASAQRPSTLAMSCQQAQNLVQRSGAIVLSTGGSTYNRFVSSGRYCSTGEYTDDGWAPTRDTTHCVLGYTCTDAPPFWLDEHHGGGLFGD